MRRRLLLTGLLWLLGTFAFAQNVESQLVDAVALYNNRAFGQSRTLLQTLSKAAPDNDAVWYYLGLDEAMLGNADAAISNLRKAVELDPHNYWYKRRLADLYAAAGEDEMVIQMCESILQEFPDKTDVLYDLLTLYLKKEQYEKALEMLDDIEKVSGPGEQAVRTRYDILRSLGRDEEAIAALEDFNEQFTSPSVLSMMGDYYLSEFKDSLALNAYNEALSAQSDYVPAMLGMAEVYRTTRRYNEYFATMYQFIDNDSVPVEAKGMYVSNVIRSLDPKIVNQHRVGFDQMVERLQLHHPSDTVALSTAGGYYYATGRLDKGIECFEKSADLYPESLGQTVSCIQILLMAERWEDVKTRCIAAFDRFQELGFMEYLNTANYYLKDYDAVINNCRYLIAREPKNTELVKNSWNQIGDMYHLKGDTKEAYKAYEKVLKIDPNYAPVLNNYAYYLSEEGKQLKKAYAMSKKTVEAEPDNATYLDTFAWILHLMGKDLEAKPFFKHAMLYGGKDSAVIMDHYAEVLYKLGEYDLAQVYWSQAKAKNTDGAVPDLDARVEARLKAIKK
ncbi:MAG: tetratricopeptide repeat protein [Bacteroidales bacterium]|nr:tetratricopeptide repeat protein [Bacteroidales bacterium]